jgi:hypothetical protein
VDHGGQRPTKRAFVLQNLQRAAACPTCFQGHSCKSSDKQAQKISRERKKEGCPDPRGAVVPQPQEVAVPCPEQRLHTDRETRLGKGNEEEPVAIATYKSPVSRSWRPQQASLGLSNLPLLMQRQRNRRTCSNFAALHHLHCLSMIRMVQGARQHWPVQFFQPL